MEEYIKKAKVIEYIEQKQKELCPYGLYSKRHASDSELYELYEDIINNIDNLPTCEVSEDTNSDDVSIQNDKDVFEGFIRAFKTELGKVFGDVGVYSTWNMISGTQGWYTALKKASEKYMPEVLPFYDNLTWCYSDWFDAWLTDCAKYIGIIIDDMD